MVRAIVQLLLAVSGVLLAACGSSRQPPPKAHSAAVARSPAAGRPITKPRAFAFARAVNLTTADVPGFTPSSEHEHETTQEKRLQREMVRCVGPVASGRGLVEQSSQTFELKHGILQLSVGSQVTVAETPAAADRQLAAIRGAHVRACLSHYITLLLKGQRFPGGATITPVSIASGTPPARGTTGGFGWRVTATIAIHGIRVSFYLDILGFVYGPSTVTLFSTGALQPFPAQVQQHLFSLLLSRAKARSL
jgi:hypothetical protein